MLLSGKLICWEWNLKISLKLSEKIKRLFLFLLKAMPVTIGITRTVYKRNLCTVGEVNIDKSGSNVSALNSINESLPEGEQIEIRQNKYLNNMIEQDHRFVKKRTRPMLGFKNIQSAKITIAGIENIRMIQKGHIVGADEHLYAFENFITLMAS